MSDRTIIKQIEQEEVIRRILLGEDRNTLLRIVASNSMLKWNIYNQFFMNRLRGLCQDCSKCCEVSDIDLNPHDIERILKHLKISQTEIVSKYFIKHPQYPSFFYRFKHKPCVFLKDKRCTIYPVRPNMCVFFPFLTGVQKEAWERYSKTKGKQRAIVIPLWCPSAIKTKEFTEKTIKMIRQMSPEEQEKVLKQLQHRRETSHP